MTNQCTHTLYDQDQVQGCIVCDKDEIERLRKVLMEATEVLEGLRRGHGVTVSAACYPALNHCREVLKESRHETA